MYNKLQERRDKSEVYKMYQDKYKDVKRNNMVTHHFTEIPISDIKFQKHSFVWMIKIHFGPIFIYNSIHRVNSTMRLHPVITLPSSRKFSNTEMYRNVSSFL